MDRKLVGVMLLVLTSSGCRACKSCCDSLPPVLDGPYPPSSARAGSAFGGMIVAASSEAEEITDPEEIQPPASEDP